jgi:hypothetical protein
VSEIHVPQEAPVTIEEPEEPVSDDEGDDDETAKEPDSVDVGSGDRPVPSR